MNAAPPRLCAGTYSRRDRRRRQERVGLMLSATVKEAVADARPETRIGRRAAVCNFAHSDRNGRS